jgi:hypothetical protein
LFLTVRLAFALNRFAALSIRLRPARLVAFVAACALIAGAAVYSAHGLTDRGHEHTHCDLCVHFSGSAGSPAQASVAGKPPLLLVRAIALPAQPRRRTHSPLGSHLPRGPPLATALT